MAGYTRQSSAEIATGEIVLAAPLNAEFNALQSAFHATTGHTHDGTSGNGPKISLSGAVSGILPWANGGTGGVTVDNTVPRFNGTNGVIQTSGVTIDDSNNVTGVAALTLTGAFTSLGIDDNATAERVQIADTLLTLGTALGTSYTVGNAVTEGPLIIAGGVSAGFGGVLRLYPDTHDTLANDIVFQNATDNVYLWDDSADTHFFSSPPGTTIARITSTGINQTAIGSTTPAAGAFTTLAASGASTLSGTVATGALTVTGTATATLFSGSGASLTNLPGAQISGVITMANSSAVRSADVADGVAILEFEGSGGTRFGFVGAGSAATADISLIADSGNALSLNCLGAQDITFLTSNTLRGTLSSAGLTMVGNVTGATGTFPALTASTSVTTPLISNSGTITIDSGTHALLVATNVFRADANNAVQLGATTFRWSDVFSVLGNFTGQVDVASLVSSGAISGTTGTFSGAVSMTALTATTGTFSSTVSMTALTATTGTFSGATSTTTSTATTAFRAAAGSAGTPSISFTADTNTGFYNTADAILASTGGTLRVTIDSTGLTVAATVTANGNRVAEMYTGSTQDETDFPIGTTIICRMTAAVARNASVTPRIDAGGTSEYRNDGAGDALTGTWRSRGRIVGQTEEYSMLQRVA